MFDWIVRGDGLLLVGCVILNHAQPEPLILLIKSISSAVLISPTADSKCALSVLFNKW